jgi:Spherulation-specific family 4
MKTVSNLVLGAAFTLSMTTHAAFSDTGCQSIGIPAYFWKSGPELSLLVNSASSSSRVSTVVIPPCVSSDPLTPCVKPGDAPIPEYVTFIAKAQSKGMKVLSYVWTNNGRRSLADIMSEINRVKANYNVDGIFLDGVAATSAYASYYRDLSLHIRSAKGGFVALNPGVMPADETYARISDLLVTFEGTYASYVSNYGTAPAWMSRYPASKFWHLVHTVPNTSAAVDTTLRLSKHRNAGSLYATNDVLDNPWNTLPAYWTGLLSRMTEDCR